MIPIGGWAATGSKLAGKGAKAARTYKRPSGFRKNVRDTVWNDAEKAAPDGQVRDPSSNEVISKEEPWHMGHRPGFEFRKHQSSAEERGITRKQFLDEHNNPDHYRPEKPQHNSGHRGEDHTDSYFGP
ncbi:HNH/ENDO VII family nuclease [Saccharopolyspora sp. HNM0986]|nr:HNH/ENDO VII family nuclease [Saccharopolyspora sp. HNM0986]